MKKKILSMAMMVLSVAAVNAQKGTILVGGDVDFSSGKTASSVKSNNFALNPTVGYQFDNNWTVGVTGGVGASKTAGVKDNYWAAGPFVRYTHPISDIFAVFGQLNATYGENKANTGTFKTELFPAVFVNVKNGFGLNFGFGGIEYTNVKVDGADNASNRFGLNFGKTARIGISKNF